MPSDRLDSYEIEQWSLKAERLNRGFNVIEFSAMIGVRPHVLRYAESGHMPAPASALKIADFFGMRVTDIWPL